MATKKQEEVLQAQALAVSYISPEEVKPYQNNPKKHSEKQITQIINSIKEFKFNNPILIDENNVLIAGHGRLLASKHLQIKEIPAIRLTHLTESQKKAYRIADNKLTENGAWDTDLLKIEFEEIQKLNLDLNLDITGFDNQEIDLLFNPPSPADNKLNKIPYIPEKEIVSKAGDIWQLGSHRIICGDALERITFERLLQDKHAAMVFTDPPYNVKINGHVCGNGAIKHKEFAMASGEMGSNEFTEFLSANFKLLKEFSKNGSLHLICMDWRHVEEISRAGHVYDEFKNICVWNKTNAGMGSLYRSKHEFIFVYKNGEGKHINNIELGSKGRYRTNVWDYAGVNTFKNTNLLKLHPTVKPIELIWDAILDVSKRGDIILDSFLGSGSTLIACEKAHRLCYGIELEPLYVDTTIRRWQELTGKEAIRESDGKSYKEILVEQLEGGQDEK
ncbi:site-specific DNA-methyltransferase [Candidatus Proelusimicrobium excrementi]|uniref:site-specific DNA-methyltransferase n=1 Tax=Candidatus Proelusimicrobium excrementi TaxID=3416222 RepID=UPI003CABADEE|nr:site-specific DNA-methyltransferase [Elusimicrobiaceae bacterium]